MPAWLAVASPLVTLITMLVGMGVMWGSLKTTVGHLKEQVEKLAESVQTLTNFKEDVRVELAAKHSDKPRRRRKQ